MGDVDRFDPEYVEYVELFNRREYDAAHRALTQAWMRNISDTFYKGLIQLAGAFVHWDEGSLFWAEDLFASAHNLLSEHAPECEGLDVDALLEQIRLCNQTVKEARSADPSERETFELPSITLILR